MSLVPSVQPWPLPSVQPWPVAAQLMSFHTLKTNVRECPVLKYKRQRVKKAPPTMAVHLVCNMQLHGILVALEAQSLDLHRAWLFMLLSRFEHKSN